MDSLFERNKDYFPIGAAVRADNLSSFVTQHFNRLTCENAMKFKVIHPEKNTWRFEDADAIANFARQNNLKMNGHAIIDRAFAPEWILGYSSSQMRSILRNHIETIIERYHDVVDNWDVANEMISDNPQRFNLDKSEGNLWHEVFGDHSYLMWLYECVQNKLQSLNSNPDIYYCDYLAILPEKRLKILTLVDELRNNGIKIDGIAFQAHWNLGWPKMNVVKEAFNDFKAHGLKVKIGEFEISVYDKDDWVHNVWEPEKAFTPDIEQRQIDKIKESFEIFRECKIEHLTFWGITDEESWLNNFPTNRRNYPLIFNNYKPKKVFYEI